MTKRTEQQQTFIDAVLNADEGENSCLRARAGSGKTQTVIELTNDYVKKFPRKCVTLCAFNNPAAKELNARLVANGHKDWKMVQAATIHSLGNGLVRFVFNPTIEQYKVRNLIDAQNGEVYKEHAHLIERLVGFAKLEGFGFFGDVPIGDMHAWYAIADHYDINGFDDTTQLDDVVIASQHIYKLSLAQTDIIDFDDMILFPLIKNIRVKFQKDLLVVDEAQDTGRARQALLRKFVKPTGTMIAVGDDRQGIYAFAGAQANALDLLIEDLNMKVFPLTISWRCRKSIIAEAQKLVPDIEPAPNAQDGRVLTLGPEAWAQVIKRAKTPDVEGEVKHSDLEGLCKTDAILCRNTAPLIEMAYKLLRQGVACKVEGREIGKGLLRMVNRWKVKTIDMYLRKLSDYRARETQKAIAKNKEHKVAEINDRCDTLVHLCNVCLERKKPMLDDLREFIDSMFADDVTKSGVLTLATYHRSKGREWERVFLLEHATRCPSPWAKQDWQRAQESNLAYVAITRAKQVLAYVS